MFGYEDDNLDEDEEAKKMVREKNTLAARYQTKPKPMSFIDVLLQHLVYKKKYSKLKDKNK